jgi:hypothetical protein
VRRGLIGGRLVMVPPDSNRSLHLV